MKTKQSVDYRCQNKSARLPNDVVEKYIQNPILQYFMLVSAGHRDGEHNIGHYVKRYSESEYIMIYCIRGRGWMLTEEKKWIIHPGDVLFCFKETIQNYGADEEMPWEIYWSCFSGKNAFDRLELLGITKDRPIFSIGNKSKITSLFSEILEILERGYALHHLIYVSDCLQQILSYLYFFSTNFKQQSEAESVVENTITLMLENIDGELKLEQLSTRAGMSVNYFAKLFQSKIGYTPIDYFIRLKMQKACALLNTSMLSVKEISYQLGYQDVYYFSRIFKKKVGYSPRQYRKLSDF